MTEPRDDQRCNCTQNRPDLHGHHPKCRLYVADQERAGDESLGGFLADFERRLEEGSDPADGCVMCGSTTRLLHPVQRAWACSKCHHTPEETADA